MTSRTRCAGTRPRHDHSSETPQRRGAFRRVAVVGFGLAALAATTVAVRIGSTIAAPPHPSPPSGGAAPPPIDPSGLTAKVAEALWNAKPSTPSTSIERTWTSGSSSAHQFTESGGTWICGYLAVGAASGSTLEVRVDDIGGRVTPAPGDVVQIACQEAGVPVYQEIFVFSHERAFGSIDDLMALDGKFPVDDP